MTLAKQSKIFTTIIAVATFIAFCIGEIGYGYTFYQTNYNLNIAIPTVENGITEYPTLGGIFDMGIPLLVYLSIFLMMCAITTIILNTRAKDKAGIITGVICLLLPLFCVFLSWVYISLISNKWGDLKEIMRYMVCSIHKGG